MKFRLLSFVTFISLSTNAQTNVTVCGKLKYKDDFLIHVYSTINGYYNVCQFDTTSPIVFNSDSFFIKKIWVKQPSFISIFFTNLNQEYIHRLDLLVMSGDSVFISGNLNSDSSNWVTFSGSNARGHILFNDINYIPYNKFSGVEYISKQLPLRTNTFIKGIDSCVSVFFSKFDSLQKSSQISKEYLRFMNLNLEVALYNFSSHKLLYGENLTTEKKNILRNFFQKLDPNDTLLQGLLFTQFYLISYYEYQACIEMNGNIEDIYKTDKSYVVNNKTERVNKQFSPLIFIKNKSLQSDVWALNLYSFYFFVKGALDYSYINQYIRIFGKNKWVDYLNTGFKNNQNIEKIEYELQSPISFIDTSKGIKSLNDLVKQLPKGTPLFVDLWASWCGPCVGEFTFNKRIDSFFNKTKIGRLYISIDDSLNLNSWKIAVHKYKLGGYHFLASQFLLNDIRRIYNLSSDDPIAIPKYLFVNKNGDLINIYAPRPSDPNFENLINDMLNNSQNPSKVSKN